MGKYTTENLEIKGYSSKKDENLTRKKVFYQNSIIFVY